MKRNTRLQHTALVLALAAAYPVVGHGAAGTAQFAAGEVTYKRGSAAPAALTKGTVLESGDSITTGARGIAQVKFSDGGYVGIQPNSQFDITRYANNDNAQSDSFLVNLARGGMRAITGLIGKRNTANYKVTTSTATVGIRGSSFQLQYNPDGTLSVSTEQDAIEICTSAGCVGLTAGESAIVPNGTDLPTRTNTRTSLPLVPFRQDPQVAGNQANADGTAAILNAVPQYLPGTAFAGHELSGEGTYNFDNGTLTLQNGGGASYLTPSNHTLSLASDGVRTFTHSEGSLQNNDFLTLGVWSNAVETFTYTDPYGGSSDYTYDLGQLAFVSGSVTPISSMGALMSGNMVGTYNMSAATPLYGTNGSTGTLNNASMSMNFGTGSGNISLDASMNQTNGDTIHYAMGGSVYMYGEGASPRFSGSIDTGSGEGEDFVPLLVINSGSASGSVHGFFSGDNAQKAGISFRAYDYDNDYRFGGAAILSGSTGSSPSTSGLAFAGGGYYGSSRYTLNFGNGIGETEFGNPDKYVKFTFYNEAEGEFFEGTVDSPSSDFTHHASRSLDSGGKLVLSSWRYSTWEAQAGGEGSSYFYGDPIAFVVGKPTADITVVSGTTATYSLSDASPLYENGSNLGGSLDYATLTVNFSGTSSSGTLAMGISTQYAGGSSYDLSGTVQATGSGFTSTVSGQGNAQGNVAGYFYGNTAQYAGIGYSGYAGPSSFAGAAILDQNGDAYAPDYGVVAGLTSVTSPVEGSALTIHGSHRFNNGLSSATDFAGTSIGSTQIAQTNHLNAGTEDFIGWGKWSAGVAYAGSSTRTFSEDVHYVVGKPTPESYWGATGPTATYTASSTAGTTPTTVGGSTNAAFESATLTLTMGSTPTVASTVVVSFDGTQFSGTVNGMVVNKPTSTFGGSQDGHTMSGLFVGPTASHAGLTYQLDAGSAGMVSGAAGLTRN